MLTPSPPVAEAPPLTQRERELVSGTYRVMARLGAQQLSLRQVAKELGISPALLVYHFESKDKLLLATMRSAILETVERVHDRLRGIDNPEEALRALVDSLFHEPRANRDFYLVYLDLIQYALRHQSFSGLSDLLWKYVNGSYAVVIQHGVAAGLFEVDDIEQAARRSRAIVEGAVLQWLQEEDWEHTHDRLRDESHEALLALLKRPAGRRRRAASSPPARVAAPGPV